MHLGSNDLDSVDSDKKLRNFFAFIGGGIKLQESKVLFKCFPVFFLLPLHYPISV